MNSAILPQLLSHLNRRDQCNQDGCAAMPVSTWQKTGIPVIISLCLFFLVFVVLFFIVRKRRLQTRKAEEAASRKIDLDDVEDRAAYAATKETMMMTAKR